MKRSTMAVLAMGVAGCAAQPVAIDPGAQVDACAAAVAAHVGKDPAEVTAVLAGTGADGLAVVNVTDGGRLHSCTVDAGLRVREIRHPGA